jgi:DNA polymerase III subunit gamma/tau
MPARAAEACEPVSRIPVFWNTAAMAKAGKKQPDSAAQKGSQAVQQGGHAALARKYRPRTFAELIGQETVVQTLRNAFQQGRIAQSYMLTGVRGVGKTTTARLIARGLNYQRPGIDGPTIDMDEEGVHCRAILEGRHLDVIEMDAASHTGIEDIREIIDSAHYRPNTARYKVYIIDEVHMLSKPAFNGLLKTLEEPPGHVKFIFATTEVRKVPVTVLSRCQRFDLKRIEIEPLIAHLAEITAAEGAKAEPAALRLIARSAEGSVRDALSVLDRAIAFAGGDLDAASVVRLLGLADRGRIFDLLETLLKGETGDALRQLAELNRDGAEPGQVIADLADAVHQITRLKALGGEAEAALKDSGLPEAEQARVADLAGRLSMASLARAWQMLLKGHDEVQNAPRPLAAADMVLVRIAYAAGLPSPADLIRRVGDAEAGQGNPASGRAGAPRRDPAPVARLDPREAPAQSPPSAEAPPDAETADRRHPPPDAAPGKRAPADPAIPGAPAAEPKSFEELVALAEAMRDLKLKHALLDQVRLVSFRRGKIEINTLPSAPKELAQEIKRRLQSWTGRDWAVVVDSTVEGDMPLGERRRMEREAELAMIRAHPAVQEVFAHFPDAEIGAVRPFDAVADDANESGTGMEDGPHGGRSADTDDDEFDERFSEDGTNR